MPIWSLFDSNYDERKARIRQEVERDKKSRLSETLDKFVGTHEEYQEFIEELRGIKKTKREDTMEEFKISEEQINLEKEKREIRKQILLLEEREKTLEYEHDRKLREYAKKKVQEREEKKKVLSDKAVVWKLPDEGTRVVLVQKVSCVPAGINYYAKVAVPRKTKLFGEVFDVVFHGKTNETSLGIYTDGNNPAQACLRWIEKHGLILEKVIELSDYDSYEDAFVIQPEECFCETCNKIREKNDWCRCPDFDMKHGYTVSGRHQGPHGCGKKVRE